jgi:iron complex outermembrane receptor protein
MTQKNLNRCITTRSSWLSFILIPALAFSGQALAQQTAGEEDLGLLEEVIVTATKRAENIQDIPVSITALSPDMIDQISQGVPDIRFLSGRVANLTIESSFGRVFPRFYIRGYGNTDFDLNGSQPVSLVVDEVVQENPILKGFPIFDVERIEVLRGPQGTLFGRNTPAGIVKIDSVKPIDVPDGYFKASYGTYNAARIEGAIGNGFGNGWSTRLSTPTPVRKTPMKDSRNGPRVSSWPMTMAENFAPCSMCMGETWTARPFCSVRTSSSRAPTA